MSTSLTFSRDSSKETIIRASDGTVLYEVQTPWKYIFATDPTLVYRRYGSPNAVPGVLAQLEMHKWSKDLAYYNNTLQPVDGLFPKKGWLSKSRLMTTRYGKWKWSSSSSKLILYNSRGKAIATYRKHHFFKKPTLDVDPEASEYLDLVIIGLLVMMRDVERRREAARDNAVGP